MFDWTADLTGTGDRSEYIVESNNRLVAGAETWGGDRRGRSPSKVELGGTEVLISPIFS